MRYLLDPHTFLWLITSDPNLSKGAEQIIRVGANTIYLSIATLWESAIKVGSGNWP